MFDLSKDAGPIGFNTFLAAGEFLINHLDLHANTSRIAISGFKEQLENVVSFSSDDSTSELLKKVFTLKQSSDQYQLNASDLLQSISDAIEYSNRRQVVVIFTQGGSVVNIGDAFHQYRATSGVRVSTVGHGSDANVNSHTALASDTAFTFYLGRELDTDVTVLGALLSLLEYDTCVGSNTG